MVSRFVDLYLAVERRSSITSVSIVITEITELSANGNMNLWLGSDLDWRPSIQGRPSKNTFHAHAQLLRVCEGVVSTTTRPFVTSTPQTRRERGCMSEDFTFHQNQAGCIFDWKYLIHSIDYNGDQRFRRKSSRVSPRMVSLSTQPLELIVCSHFLHNRLAFRSRGLQKRPA